MDHDGGCAARLPGGECSSGAACMRGGGGLGSGALRARREARWCHLQARTSSGNMPSVGLKPRPVGGVTCAGDHARADSGCRLE